MSRCLGSSFFLQVHTLKASFGGDICYCDINTHKGYYPSLNLRWNLREYNAEIK